MSDPAVAPYTPDHTGTLADVVESGPQLGQVRPAGPDGFLPPPSWGQLFTAARPSARRSTPLYDDAKVYDGYAPILETLGLPPSENPAHFPEDKGLGSDLGALMGGFASDLATAAGQGSRSFFSSRRLATRQLQEELVAAQIRARRLKDPGILPGLPDTAAGLNAYFEEQEAKKRAAGSAVLARGSTFGSISAQFAAGGVESATHDPFFLPSMAIGGGTASTVLQAVGRDALINGVLAASQLPVEEHNMAENGEHLTLADAATQIGTAAAIGAGAGAVIHVGATHVAPTLFKIMPASVQQRWAGRMRVGEGGPLLKDVLADMDNHELSSFARSTIGGRMTPDETAAANVLERSQDLGQASPFVAGPAGDAAHNQGLADALKSIIDGAPRETNSALLSSSSPLGLRSAEPIKVPANDAGFEAQWAAIKGNEHGIGSHGEFLTSPAGAIGPGQVMPGTAPHAARLAGVPFDDHLYRTDAAYNEKLGRAYYAEQLRTFGDPEMAAAAYNAGPGSAARGTGLRGAMKRAAEHGEPGNWRAYLPHETQRYVEDFNRRTGFPAGEAPAIADAAADPELAALRDAADQAEGEALDLSRQRPDVDLAGDRAQPADVPVLRRELFASDEDWAAAQSAFHQSLNSEPLAAGNGAPAGEEGARPAEVAPAATAAPGASEGPEQQRAPGARPAPFEGHVAVPLVGFSEPVVVAATRVGDFAVHHPILDGEAKGRGWQITHGPSGLKLDSVMPDAARQTKRAAVAFAQELSAAAEPELAAIRPLSSEIGAAVLARREPPAAAVPALAAIRDAAQAIAAGEPPRIRIDDPELKAFDEGGSGRKDQLESLEHDLKMQAEEQAAEHLDRRLAELGPEPKKPRDFAGVVKGLLQRQSKAQGIAYRIDADDAISHGVDADAIYVDPKARYPKVKVGLSGIFSSSKAPLRSRARAVKLVSLDWLGDRVDPQAFGIHVEGRLEPAELGDLLHQSIVEKGALDRSDPAYDRYVAWEQQHNRLRSLEGEPAHPVTGETLPEALARAEQLRETFPAAEPDGSPGTHNIANSAPAPGGGTRGELRAKIFNALIAKPARAERQAHLVLGPPAAGKSSVAEPLAEATGSRLVDADEAKALLPEFDNGIGADAVHEESTRLAAVAADATIRKGENIVLPIVGRTTEGVSARIQDLLKAGYNVHVHLVDLPGDKAVERAIARFSETGRLVPLDYIRSIGDKPRETFARILEEYKGQLGGHVHVTNDVPFGQKPRLVEASSDELAARLGYDRGAEPGQGSRAESGGSASEQPGSAQEGVSGLKSYRLAEDGEEQTLPEILAALDAERSAIAALQACAA